jgi:hypothetical protein
MSYTTENYPSETEILYIQAPIKQVRKKLHDTDEFVPLMFPKAVHCKRTDGNNRTEGAVYHPTMIGDKYKMYVNSIAYDKLVLTAVNVDFAMKVADIPREQNEVFFIRTQQGSQNITILEKKLPVFPEFKGFYKYLFCYGSSKIGADRFMLSKCLGPRVLGRSRKEVQALQVLACIS